MSKRDNKSLPDCGAWDHSSNSPCCPDCCTSPVNRNIRKLEKERDEARLEAFEFRSVLGLIATPKRPDGTYNRGREACEALATKVLEADDE